MTGTAIVAASSIVGFRYIRVQQLGFTDGSKVQPRPLEPSRTFGIMKVQRFMVISWLDLECERNCKYNLEREDLRCSVGILVKSTRTTEGNGMVQVCNIVHSYMEPRGFHYPTTTESTKRMDV